MEQLNNSFILICLQFLWITLGPIAAALLPWVGKNLKLIAASDFRFVSVPPPAISAVS